MEEIEIVTEDKPLVPMLWIERIEERIRRLDAPE